MKPQAFRFSEGLILAAIPAIAYLFAFAYETGYASYFRLPVEFIEIDLRSILIVAAGLYAFLYTILMLSRILPMRSTIVILRSFLTPIVFGLIFWALLRANIGVSWKIISFTVFFFFVWSNLLNPIKKYKGSIIDRWDAENQRDEEAASRQLEGSFLGTGLSKLVNLGIDPIVLRNVYLFLIIGLGVCNQAGYIRASIQKSFLRPSAQKELIILRRWGNYFVAASYDTVQQQTKTDFHLISFSSKNSLSFSSIYVKDIKRPPAFKNGQNIPTQKVKPDTLLIRPDTLSIKQ